LSASVAAVVAEAGGVALPERLVLVVAVVAVVVVRR
jgi:hypothetical protein